MESFDFIVIGGGMMGAPCARYLAEAGHRVALVCPPEPARYADSAGPFASHWDAARITRHVASDPVWARASARSIARYSDLEARSGRRIYHETGALMAGLRDGPLADWTAGFLRVADGVEGAARLDAAEVRDRLGIALPVGAVSSFEATGGGWMDPRAMRAAQTELAQAAGATLIPQAATARAGGTVTLADGSRLAGGHVVVATGPHAGSDGLLPARPAMTVWARTVAFARLSEAEGARLAALPSLIWVPEGWDHDLYMLPPVRYPDGRLYLKIGGQKDGPTIGSGGAMRDWFHGTGDPQVGARLLAEMRRVLPGLDVEAERLGPCAVVWSRTGYPYIERLDEHVTVLCGGNGASAKCGDEWGRLGAVAATGGDPSGEGYPEGFAAAWD
ncbi:NAD(P)/FAD-dependent oxidoreductase [Jannaschia ovalis]|uniref:FAD-binding oxidoreductase n=1 Tax=Jannaschia ovalis TaxID=3038773 RepID=A0ABY8LDT2_9RHOB|nr:FAD-binding oxidoreductase [Jannaschia sp. GRR-S6-38]WGH79480.1 FAD-binding oxidoreductase [Jannaschia sp. GRR-S6-38]